MISACFMQLVASLKYDLSGEDNWTWTSLLLNPFCTPQRSGFKFSTEYIRFDHVCEEYWSES